MAINHVRAVQERIGDYEDRMDFCIMQVIATDIGEQNEPAYPSLRNIASRSGCHYNTASTRITKLVEDKHLLREKKGKYTYYTLPYECPRIKLFHEPNPNRPTPPLETAVSHDPQLSLNFEAELNQKVATIEQQVQKQVNWLEEQLNQRCHTIENQLVNTHAQLAACMAMAHSHSDKPKDETETNTIQESEHAPSITECSLSMDEEGVDNKTENTEDETQSNLAPIDQTQNQHSSPSKTESDSTDPNIVTIEPNHYHTQQSNIVTPPSLHDHNTVTSPSQNTPKIITPPLRGSMTKGEEGRREEGSKKLNHPPFVPPSKKSSTNGNKSAIFLKAIQEFAPDLDSLAFQEKWAEWEQHRKEIRKTLKPTTRSRQLKKAAQHTEEQAIWVIDQSIENGWTGLFWERLPAQIVPNHQHHPASLPEQSLFDNQAYRRHSNATLALANYTQMREQFVRSHQQPFGSQTAVSNE